MHQRKKNKNKNKNNLCSSQYLHVYNNENPMKRINQKESVKKEGDKEATANGRYVTKGE
jgi:hypothetical protein